MTAVSRCLYIFISALRKHFLWEPKIWPPFTFKNDANKYHLTIFIYHTDAMLRKFDYLQRDFRGETMDVQSSSPCSHDDELREDIRSIRPELVILTNLPESQYIMKVKAMIQRLGYHGSFQDLRRGRGKGVFWRRDLVDGQNGSVYRSRRPSPQH